MFLAFLSLDVKSVWVSKGADSQRGYLVPQRGKCPALEPLTSMVSEPLMLVAPRRGAGSVLYFSLGLVVVAAGVLQPSRESLLLTSTGVSTEERGKS